MIAFLEGKLDSLGYSEAVMLCAGVGYGLRISLHTHQHLLPHVGMSCRVHTFLHIKEDAHTLYGFAEAEEKSLFAQLIGVSGLGPGTALLLLSGLNPSGLRAAIATGDVNTIKMVKGIGPKTAQRIVLELQDKVGKESHEASPMLVTAQGNSTRAEALQALVTLGMARSAVEKTVDRALAAKPDSSTEELIRIALRDH